MVIKNFRLSSLMLTLPLLTTALSAMDDNQIIADYLGGKSKAISTLAPDKNIATEFGERFVENTKNSFSNNSNYFYTMCSRIWHDRDIGPYAMDLFEEYMTPANHKLINEFFKGSGKDDGDFNVEALRPLVETLRKSISCVIAEVYLKQKLFADSYETGRHNIYENKSVFLLILEETVPDCITGKNILLKVADIPFVRDYLTYKFDELIINTLLSFYQQTTKKTVKHTLAELVTSLAQQNADSQPVKQSATEANATGDISQKSVKQALTTPITEDKAENEPSKIWEYFAPRLQHFLRIAFAKKLKTYLSESGSDFASYALKKATPQDNMFSIYLCSATAGYTFGQNYYGFLGGLAGVPAGIGAAYIGKLAKTSLLQTLQSRVINHFDLLFDYYSYKLIPYSADEHYLYHVNDKPLETERQINYQDHAAANAAHERGLMSAVLHDISNYSWFLNFLKPYDEKILLEATDKNPVQKNNYSQMIKLGGLLAKQQRNLPLSSAEKQLLENLQDFPSYDIKRQEIEVTTLWGQKSQQLHNKVKEVKANAQIAQTRLLDYYRLYGKEIPAEIAMAYQGLSSSLHYFDSRLAVDFIDVEESVAQGILAVIDTFSETKIKLLAESVKDYPFLLDYINKFMHATGTTDVSYEEAKALIQTPDFISKLPEDYSRHKNKKYIEQHSDSLEKLKKSVYGFDQLDLDIIELHSHLTTAQLEDLDGLLAMPSLSYDDALAQAVSALETRQTAGLSTGAKAINNELEVIGNILHGLIKENEQDIIDHFAEQFITKGDLTLFAEQVVKGQTPTDTQVNEQWQARESEFQPKLDELKATPQQIGWALAQIERPQKEGYQSWVTFNNFKASLKPLLSDAKLRTAVYTQISKKLFSQILDLHKTALKKSSATINTPPVNNGLLSGFLYTTPKIVENPVDHKPVATGPIEPFALTAYKDIHTCNKKDVAAFNLAEIVRNLMKNDQIVDITKITFTDIAVIYGKVQDRKKQIMQAEAFDFGNTHPLELVAFKDTLDAYKGKIFYGYWEIYNEMCQHKITPFVKMIKNQPIR